MTDAHTTRAGRLRTVFLEGEYGRRLVHAGGAVFPALYALPWVEWRHVVALMVFASAVAAVLEFLRLRVGLEWFVYEHLTREYEKDSPAAYLLYMFSATAVAIVFEPRIAIPAILMLALADPVAGMVGSGGLRLVKPPRALATMFVASAVLAAPFFHEVPLAVALGALGATVADGVKPSIRGFVLDDDLTIAPFAAIGLWAGYELQLLLF